MGSAKMSKLINGVVNWLRFQKEIGIEAVELTGPVKTFLGIQDHTADPQNSRRDVGVSADNSSPPRNMTRLFEVRGLLGDCKRCELHKTRKNIVFGEGPEDARLFIVGEAPGREEDIEGRPFVGPSGELLTKMLKAIGIERSEVYIASVIKCRPPENRTPTPREISSCAPFLVMQIQAVCPEFILAMGQTAAQRLIDTRKPIHELRGAFYPLFQGVEGLPDTRMPNTRVIVTYHPAYILRLAGDRQKAVKLEAWKDLQMLQNAYKKG